MDAMVGSSYELDQYVRLSDSVTSGVNFTKSHRFEFPYDVESGSCLDPIKDATVLGPIKDMPFGSPRKTQPLLHGPPRGGRKVWLSGWQYGAGAGRIKERNPREPEA